MFALTAFKNFWLHPLQRTKNPRSGGKNIIIISAGGLGDTALFSLVFNNFANLKEKDETVTLLLRSDAQKMSFLFPKNIKIKAVDFDLIHKNRSYRKRICEELFSSHYRLLISTDFLKHPYKDEAIIRGCQADITLGIRHKPWAKYDRALKKNMSLYDRLYDSGPIVQDKVVRWSNFSNWLNDKNKSPPKITSEIKTLSGDKNKDNIVFVPFSAVAEKQVPPEFFHSIATLIDKRYPITVVGTSPELAKNPGIASLIKAPGIFFNNESFEKIIPFLETVKLVISVDTAFMHLSVMLGVPTLCLASAAYVREIVPYSEETTPENVKFLYTPMECESCLGVCSKPLENNIYPCVARIDEAAVLEAVSSLLNLAKNND